MAVVLSLFVPHISFLWCLVGAVLRDCGVSWISSHMFFNDSTLMSFIVAESNSYLSP